MLHGVRAESWLWHLLSLTIHFFFIFVLGMHFAGLVHLTPPQYDSKQRRRREREREREKGGGDGREIRIIINIYVAFSGVIITKSAIVSLSPSRPPSCLFSFLLFIPLFLSLSWEVVFLSCLLLLSLSHKSSSVENIGDTFTAPAAPGKCRNIYGN